MKYILWCQQQSNFQTRTLLIPVDMLGSERKQQLDKIKQFRDKNNVIVIDTTWTYEYDEQGKRVGGCGTVSEKDKEISRLCSDFEYYADRQSYDDGYLRKEDLEWLPFSFNQLCGGFNHVKNYQQLLTLKEWEGKPVNIVDSYLILGSDDGVLSVSPWDTPDAMMLDIYGYNSRGFTRQELEEQQQ
jgi:hypothetical protein